MIRAPGGVRLRRAIAGLLMAVAVVFPSAAGAQTAAAPEAPAPRQFKDWVVRCDVKAGGSPEACFMFQDVAAPEGDGRAAQVVVGRFGQERLLGALVFVPLGVRLPPGLTFQVDDRAPRRVPLEMCTPKGCQAQIAIDDVLLGQLKSGLITRITFHDAIGRPVDVNVSLQGFTAAFGEVS